MAERVLALRELNRATLQRQLLLERKRLSPKAVIERLVGMQAQWPSAPYLGIWTRTTSFRRKTLERELASGAVVKATVIRQTLHLVTRRDYGLFRAAMSETNFPGESSLAKRLALSVRALAAAGPVTRADALARLEHDHGEPVELAQGIEAHETSSEGVRSAAPVAAPATAYRRAQEGPAGRYRSGSWLPNGS